MKIGLIPGIPDYATEIRSNSLRYKVTGKNGEGRTFRPEEDWKGVSDDEATDFGRDEHPGAIDTRDWEIIETNIFAGQLPGDDLIRTVYIELQDALDYGPAIITIEDEIHTKDVGTIKLNELGFKRGNGRIHIVSATLDKPTSNVRIRMRFPQDKPNGVRIRTLGYSPKPCTISRSSML
jgi:hypothetical protein